MGAFFKIGVKEDPNYNPYGTVFTDRQQAIINGEFVENLRKTEVTKIIRKAEKLELFDLAEDVFALYERMLTGDNRFANLSEEQKEKIIADCKVGLQKLTPWKISW